MNRIRRSATALTGLAVVLALSSCGSDSSSGDDKFSSGTPDNGTIVIGSANFPENELLMEIYAGALEAKGVDVETKPNIGAREIYLKAFEQGEIGLLPEYNGALLSYLSGSKGVAKGITSPDDVYAALQKVLPDGAETLPQSAAEDKDTLTVTPETAQKYDLSSIADLAPVASQLSVGAGAEWRERYQGLVGLKDLYGVEFGEFKPLDSGGPLTIAALKDGSVDVANVFSTDPNIAANKWVVLSDPKNLYLAENIVPLIQSDLVTPDVKDALDAVSQALTTDNLTSMMAEVVLDKKDPKVVASEFLSDNGLDG